MKGPSSLMKSSIILILINISRACYWQDWILRVIYTIFECVSSLSCCRKGVSKSQFSGIVIQNLIAFVEVTIHIFAWHFNFCNKTSAELKLLSLMNQLQKIKRKYHFLKCIARTFIVLIENLTLLNALREFRWNLPS